MRLWDDWLTDFLKDQTLSLFLLGKKEQKNFCKVELALTYLRMIEKPVDLLPEYLSGYPLFKEEQLQKLTVIASSRLPSFSLHTLWKQQLSWYLSQNRDIRLFDVDEQSGRVLENHYCLHKNQREQSYILVLNHSPSHKTQTEVITRAGQYEIRTNQRIYEYTVSQNILDRVSNPPRDDMGDLQSKQRDSIKVHINDLQQAAHEMAELDPDGNWITRWKRIKIEFLQEGSFVEQSSLNIEEVFHLVGMMGSGKSTFIDILIYHLIKQQNKHITLIVNTVVDSLDKARFFQRLGIKAFPIRGQNRQSHMKKYGRAHKADLDPKHLFAVSDPSIVDEKHAIHGANILTNVCPLSSEILAQGEELFAPGEEPCENFYRNRQRYFCPFRFVCPTHLMNREINQASLWIVNSSSFIQTSAAIELTPKKMTIAEAVYNKSDLLIVDEADRVQAEWDQKFIPKLDLYGSPFALPRLLRQNLSKLEHDQYELLLEYYQVDTKLRLVELHTSNLIKLLYLDHFLEEWAKHPLNNGNMYDKLAKSLATNPKNRKQAKRVAKQLLKKFKQFYRRPANEHHPLSKIMVNSQLTEYELSLMQLEIESWIKKSVPSWSSRETKEKFKLVRKLQVSLMITFIDHSLRRLLHEMKGHPDLAQVHNTASLEFFQRLMPASPIGTIIGYSYERKGNNPLFQYMQSFGMGRWILLNYHRLFESLDGIKGPHVLLTSATSWAPGSPQYHVFIPPHAVLKPPVDETQAIMESTFDFLPKYDASGDRITVSGVQGEERLRRLKLIANLLVREKNLTNELRHWKGKRKVLLVVGSYEEAKWVTYEINQMSSFVGRAACMISDDEDDCTPLDEKSCIRRGEIEQFRDTDFEILVAPLKAIERGYNIVDKDGNAVLGTVFFLVRPAHSPLNLYPLIMGIYHRVMKECHANNEIAPLQLKEWKKRWRNEWYIRLQCTNAGLSNLPMKWYQEQIWDQFVMVWQTIGRLVRGGNPCHVYFVDAAFCPDDGRQMLTEWHEMLKKYIESTDCTEKALAELLFMPAYKAFKEMREENSCLISQI